MIRKKDLLNKINDLSNKYQSLSSQMASITNEQAKAIYDLKLENYLNKYGLYISTYFSLTSLGSKMLKLGDIELKEFSHYTTNSGIIKWIEDNKNIIEIIVEKKIAKRYQKITKSTTKKKK